MKLTKIIIASITSFVLSSSTFVLATVLPNHEMADTISENHLLPISQRLSNHLADLSTVSSFKSEMSLVNKRSNEQVAHITIFGNNETGNARIQFDFYNRLKNPNHYRLTLYAYNHFELVYVSVADWLQSMAYFDQPYFTADTTEKMNEFKDTYVEVSANNLKGSEYLTNLSQAFLLLPNLERLVQADSQQFYYIDDFYTVNLERTEIPEMIFADTANISLNLDTEIEATLNKLAIVPKVSIANLNNGLALQSVIKSKNTTELLATITDLPIERLLPTLDQMLGISTSIVTEKLTDFNLTFNEKSLRYKLVLGGLSENFNLNLFKDSSANFRSYEFELTYQFQLFSWEMPELLTLNRLSQSEWNYLVNKQLKQ